MAQQTPTRAKPAPRLTPGEVLAKVRRFHKDMGYWPTLLELAEFMERRPGHVGDKLRLLRQRYWVEVTEDGQIVPAEEAMAASEVKTEVWDPERLRRHLEALGVDPEPRPRPRTADRRTMILKEVQQGDMTPKAKYDWPPDRELVQRAEELHKAGQSYAKVLAGEIGCQPHQVNQRVAEARERLGLPRRMGPVPKKPGPSFTCETCRDSGKVNGTWCSCAIGQRMKESYEKLTSASYKGKAEAESPPAQPEDALLPDDEAAQGDDTTPQATEPPAAATANESTVRTEVPEPESEAPIVRPPESGEAAMRRTLEWKIKQLELANKEQQQAIEQLRSEKAALAATLERYVQEQAEQRNVMAVLLYVGEEGAVEHSLLTRDCRPVNPGDEWAREIPAPNNRWRVEVWHCTDLVTPRGMVPICVMRPGPAPASEDHQTAA